MLYVFRSRVSEGANLLADALGGRRYRGRFVPIQQRVQPRDMVICWGEALAPITGVRVLNGANLTDKYEDAQRLVAAGISTVTVSATRQANTVAAANDPAQPIFSQVVESAWELAGLPYRRTPVLIAGISDFQAVLARLATALQTPLPEAVQWLPRLSNHVGGNDLLRPPAAPNYWAKKENFVSEYRVHSFMGRSIRAGRKEPREGFTNPHSWIRSYDGGWFINYDGFESSTAMRELAKRAVTALGLQFGAVDIGERADGSLLVLEVNRAPGLEGGTVNAYANAINTCIGDAA